MRFYNPETNPAEKVDSKELFPKCDEVTATQRCLSLGLLPSVTSIVSILRQEHLERWKMSEAIKNYQRHGNTWKAIDELYSNRDSKEASFGTAVHEVVELFAQGKKPHKTQAATYALPALEWIQKTSSKILESETTLISKDLGCAGTIDLAIEDKEGNAILADVKVVKFRKAYPPNPGLGYRCQLSAYKKMLESKIGKPVRCVSLYLASPFGDQTDPELRVFNYEKDYWSEFQSCLTIWHALYGDGHEKVENSWKK